MVALIPERRLRLNQYPYYEAPSLAIGVGEPEVPLDAADDRAGADRRGDGASAIVSLRAPSPPGDDRPVIAVVVVCAVTLGRDDRDVCGERRLNLFARDCTEASPMPRDWVDRATGGESAHVSRPADRNDANPIWLTEFWNNSIDAVWSVDGTAPAAHAHARPRAPDGTLSPDPE